MNSLSLGLVNSSQRLPDEKFEFGKVRILEIRCRSRLLNGSEFNVRIELHELFAGGRLLVLSVSLCGVEDNVASEIESSKILFDVSFDDIYC